MKVIFAKNIGFCSGVKRAMAIAKKSLEEDPRPIYFLGHLIHNEEVMKELERKGGKIISTLKQVKSGTLIIKAHGVSPTLFEKIPKSVLVRDATCPLVKSAQLKAQNLFKDGYQVIIFGTRSHPEVIGIKGHTKNQAIVVENKNQVKNLPKFNKIGFLAQTTQDVGKFKEIFKILKNKARAKKVNFLLPPSPLLGRGIKWFNTICPEVITRQKELNEILKRCDGVLIIGSRASANTKRLVEKVRKSEKKVFWINYLDELKKKRIKGIPALGVVSGTSTPNWEIEKIKKWLKDAKQK